MKIRNTVVPLLVLLVLTAAASVVSAQEWKKIGEKEVSYKIDHDTVHSSWTNQVREVHFRVEKAPIKIQKVIFTYKDGVRKEMEYVQDIKVGEDSPSINIEGDGHIISKIDIWYNTDS